MEDEWYSGGGTTGGAIGGAVAGGGGTQAGMAATGGGYGDSFTPPTSRNGVLAGQVGCCRERVTSLPWALS